MTIIRNHQNGIRNHFDPFFFTSPLSDGSLLRALGTGLRGGKLASEVRGCSQLKVTLRP